MKSLTDPGKDKPEKEAKAAKAKPLADPGAGKPENEAKEARVKAWKAPAVGDVIRGKKCTKPLVAKEKGNMRASRQKGWEETLWAF